MMNMSKQALYDQLTSKYGEQFTPKEAQYAVEGRPHHCAHGPIEAHPPICTTFSRF
ncbi:MAG: Ltp family lipoprotein [Atopobiaceae bacterium]|nr:Ltp family lipoprotein [Atopobiaceae bacterium]MBR1830514.1 Ltp family lipoprotein [Atopobiaceae bacterium]